MSKLSELYYIYACIHIHKTLIKFAKNKNGNFDLSLLLKSHHSAPHHRSWGAQSPSLTVNWFWPFWSKLVVVFPFMHLLKSFLGFLGLYLGFRPCSKSSIHRPFRHRSLCTWAFCEAVIAQDTEASDRRFCPG